MEKVSTYYLLGKARAFQSMGLQPEQVKLAFEKQHGLTPEEADALVKEAFWGRLAKGLMTGGKWLAGKAGKFVPMSSTRAVMPWKTQASEAIKGTLAGWGSRIGRGMQSSGQALEKSPIRALGSGAWNFGKGMLFRPTATGVGGTLGKGTAGALIAGSVLGGGGGGPQTPPPPYGGQMMRNPYMMG